MNLLGYNFTINSNNEILSEILTKTKYQSVSVFFLNPHSIVVADSDQEAKSAFISADYRFVDGIGLKLALCLKYFSFKAIRTTGWSFFKRFSSFVNSQPDSFSVFFLGSRPHDLEVICKKYRADYKNISVVGSYSPPYRQHFSKQDIESFHHKISASGADIIWVGLTAPKQEKVIEKLTMLDSGRLYVGVGAVFDYYCGNLKRPSRYISAIGLEWAHRLILQPRHVYRRIFYSIPKFLFILAWSVTFTKNSSR